MNGLQRELLRRAAVWMEEAIRAIEIAAEVRQVVREALKIEGVELPESET